MSDPLFDAVESERRKQAGRALAEGNRRALLEYARAVARDIARQDAKRECDADRVQQHLNATLGATHAALGPAAGSLFRGRDWKFTGRRVKSASVKNHARELKVWKLVTKHNR